MVDPDMDILIDTSHFHKAFRCNGSEKMELVLNGRDTHVLTG